MDSLRRILRRGVEGWTSSPPMPSAALHGMVEMDGRGRRRVLRWVLVVVSVLLIIYVGLYYVLSRRGMAVMEGSGADYVGFWYVGMEPRELVRDDGMKGVEVVLQRVFWPAWWVDNRATGMPWPEAVTDIDPDSD